MRDLAGRIVKFFWEFDTHEFMDTFDNEADAITHVEGMLWDVGQVRALAALCDDVLESDNNEMHQEAILIKQELAKIASRRNNSMFIIEKTKESTGNIYPGNEFLIDYENSDFGTFISVLGIEVMVGKSTWVLGDSGISVKITCTYKKGMVGMEELKQYAKDFVAIAEDAVPTMSEPYAKVYKYFLDDFKENGLVMPTYGRIL